MFFDLVAKASLTTVHAAGAQIKQLLGDLAGALWVRDYMTQPAQSGAAITKSDATVLTGVRAIWVGGAGDVAITGQDDVSFTLVGVAAGTLIPVAAKKVLSTGTTASSMVALY